MIRQLLPGLRVTLVLTVLTGLIYPGIVTGLCQWLFPAQANGSLVIGEGRIVGSTLIGQAFSRPEYFHPRPSAADYDASASSGSNLGPTNRKLVERLRASALEVRKENPGLAGAIPADMITASGSGLDPHISPANALAQVARVAGFRKADPSLLRKLVARHTEDRDLSILGEPRVNVLVLNLALDREFPMK
jgi:potassium-transporting ATPase KdpC subunit